MRTRPFSVGGKFPRGETIGPRKEADFWIMEDYTWARDRQVYGFVDFGDGNTCGGYNNESCSKIHFEAGECYYTETRAVNEAGYISEPMITNGVLIFNIFLTLLLYCICIFPS